MTDDPIDAILKQGPKTPPVDGPPVDEAVLLAYLAGTLPPDASASVDQRLAVDSEARRLLVALSEPLESGLVDWAVGRFDPPRAVLAPSRRWPWVAAAGVALAAGLVVTVWPPTPIELPEYRLDPVGGAVQMTRADRPKPSAERVFLPHSKVNLILRPTVDLTASAPSLGVFVNRPGGPLREIRPRPDAAANGTYALSPVAETLFGRDAGSWQVHLVLSAHTATLDALPGQALQAARAASPDVNWFSVGLRYVLAADEVDRPR